MTTPTTAPAHARHEAGYAVFNQALQILVAAGWTRRRVDTLARPDHDWVVRHQFCAGTWELHFEPDAAHRRTRGMPTSEAPRVSVINLHRPPLPTAEQVISQLFGPHMHLARPRPSSNGGTDVAVKSVGA